MAEQKEGERMKGGPVYTVIFTLVISAVFTLVLSLANAYYLPRIEENELLDDRRAVLYVFELDAEGGPEEVLERFENAVVSEMLADMEIYAHLDEDEQVLAYAVPFTGAGLWGTMRGYLGITPELDRITGLVFTEHNETPGLGARIDEREYLEQFRGLEITGELAYGPAGDDRLDAITGATSTSKAVLRILNNLIDRKIAELEVVLDD